ncbi:MAG: choice-of-anchor L domain-containing protein, partial [Pauljensenia sp.]
LRVVPVSAVRASPGQDVTSLRDTDAASLVQELAGEGVTVTSASFEGLDVQAGRYADLAFDALSPSTGVVLSTGSVIDSDPTSAEDVDFTYSSVLGPNKKLTTTGDLGGAGSPALEGIFGETTYDAAVLTLTVVPEGEELALEYVFGSEEYSLWSDRDYSDAFAVLVDGEVCSLVPGTSDPVGTTTVNPSSNADLHVVNFVGTDPGAVGLDTELNAFTVPLTCVAEVDPGEESTVVVAIADTRDGQLDSAVLLAGSSLTSPPDSGPTPTPTPTPTPSTPAPTSGATSPPTGGATPVKVVGGGSGRLLARTGADLGPIVAVVLLLAGAGLTAVRLARRNR